MTNCRTLCWDCLKLKVVFLHNVALKVIVSEVRRAASLFMNFTSNECANYVPHSAWVWCVYSAPSARLPLAFSNVGLFALATQINILTIDDGPVKLCMFKEHFGYILR